eukprot:2709460-Amphidinium_carterae.1
MIHVSKTAHDPPLSHQGKHLEQHYANSGELNPLASSECSLSEPTAIEHMVKKLKCSFLMGCHAHV